ncbi:MAG: hypothetical protein ABI277_10915 [Burkholderiaceae bacterium]
MPPDHAQRMQVDKPGPGVVRLFAGMVIAPLAWALQVLTGYALAAHACYPTDAALSQPTLPHLRAIVAGVSVSLWILLLIGCAVAWSNWKATRPHSDVGPHRIIQSGEGRPRFMALCGLIVSGLFAIVLLFTSVGIIWVPGCGP